MNSGFEFLDKSELQNKTSYKWRQNSESTIPLTVAEMDYNVAPAIRAGLHSMVESSDMGYLGKFPELQSAFAGFARRHWNWEINNAKVRIANDLGAAVSEVLHIISKPGERVLINSPVTNFADWLKEVGRVPHVVPLINQGMQYSLDIVGIEHAFQDGVRIYLLCNPHSPVGANFPRQDLLRIAELADKYGAIVLSDEIHGPLVYQEFTPFLTLGPAAKKVGIAFSSASKAFNIAGLKCALYLTENPTLDSQLDLIPESARHRASLFGAIATAIAFTDCDDWLADAKSAMQSNAHLLKDLLAQNFPLAHYRVPDFAYLAWIDFTENWVARFKEADVALLAGPAYGKGLGTFARLNFATSPEILKEAFSRIK